MSVRSRNALKYDNYYDDSDNVNEDDNDNNTYKRTVLSLYSSLSKLASLLLSLIATDLRLHPRYCYNHYHYYNHYNYYHF